MANKHAKAKNLRARALVSLVAIIVVVAVCAYLGLYGFGKGTMINYLKPWGDAISLGLDLRGGVYTVYQAENNGDPDFDTKMESTVSILTSRLTRQGFTEATVTRQGNDRIRVEISKIEGEFEAEPKEKPRVLLYHTHSYEAFAQDPDNPYEETTQWRSADADFNIMAVGAKLKEELEARGIEVVHDRTEHEPPKLGTAYIRSLATLEKYQEAGEAFDMVLDIHRDAASARNTNPSCVTANGKDYARLMMLIGTGEGDDDEGFSIKPNWQENYKLAEALTEGLNERIPGICRDIMVKTGRYNQHMSERAVLIEVGHNENTLQEALNATEPLADVIADLLLDPASAFAS